MKRKIDSKKYEIVVRPKGVDLGPGFGHDEIVIRNVFNGNVIPEDEPLFIFRAKDKFSAIVLQTYFTICQKEGCTIEQLEGIRGMQSEFAEWQRNNPDKMKQPGSTMPEDMKKLDFQECSLYFSVDNTICNKPKGHDNNIHERRSTYGPFTT